MSNDESEDEGLPQGTKNYITPQGHERLREELRNLLYEERPKMVQVVQWAAGNGDRSENGDYIYGKKRLREIDRRIHFLNRRLDRAEVVDPLKHPPGDRILFGARVIVEDSEGVRKEYRIVGVDEVDVSQGAISWISPVGRAILGKKVGDYVELHLPRGVEELEILSFSY